MQIHQIRNATVKITYAGNTFLVDPWLLPKDAMPGFEGAFHSEVRQPRVELPLPVAEIVKADAVILTHVHPDHWDEMAANHIQKQIPFLCSHKPIKPLLKNMDLPTCVFCLRQVLYLKASLFIKRLVNMGEKKL